MASKSATPLPLERGGLLCSPRPTPPPRAEQALLEELRELERAVAARDEFISTIGHELRNPISPIYLQVGHLLDTVRATGAGPIDAAWLGPRLEALHGRLRSFLGTLDRLLDLSQIGAGRVALDLEDVDLAQVIAELAAGLERQLGAACCELRLEVPGPVIGRWDRTRIEQIGANLLQNAMRYGAGAPILVRVEAMVAQARLTVRDQGVGIALEDQERIFEPYERAGPGRRAGGLGVGLWITRQLCAALGGEITVESRPGAGATFTVTLPLRPDPTEATP